jgi:hypothetical protein
MEKSNKKLEREINDLIARQLRETGLLVLQQVRLHPREMDIVLMDPSTLRLATLEIKRGNWRRVLSQAAKAKLYCHFAIAVLPMSLRGTVPSEEFASRGIGLIFYEELDGSIGLTVASAPTVSDVINRPFKQLVYQQFHARYGEMVYA